MATAGIVLAAGQSARFGAGNKLLADFRGRPLASYAAAAMRAARFDHKIAVIASAEVADLFGGHQIVAAPVTGLAQSGSLRLGLAHARKLGAEHVVIALADMPFVTAALLDAVAGAAVGQGAAVAFDGAARKPPAAFGKSYFDRLAAMTGDRGAAPLIRALPARALVRADPAMLADIDTPADLAALAARGR